MAVIELTKKIGSSSSVNLPVRSLGIKTGIARKINPEGKGLLELNKGQIFISDGVITNYPAAERFRIIRAQIERKNRQEKRYQVIAVCSAIPQEGKSVTAVNLARAFAKDEKKRTLLIDCDMRKSSVHKIFDIKSAPGFSEVLRGKLSVGDAIQAVSPGLDILCAGSAVSDPSSSIESSEFIAYINELRNYYNYVILDCPPVLLCPEPITISTVCDGTLMVVRAWKTDRRLVADATKLIGRDKIIGAVVNESFDSSKSYQTYDYYGYYEHSGVTEGADK